MDECEIRRLERLATDTWYDDGEAVTEGEVLGNYGEPKKIYRYGDGSVEVWKYDDFVVVFYRVTNSARLFRNKNRGFQYARDRANHVRAINRLLGW